MMQFFQTVSQILTRFLPSLRLGIRTTLLISISGTLFGLLLGLIVGGIRAIKLDYNASILQKTLKKLFDLLSSAYITIFRGTPMMVQAVFIYYALLNVFYWDKLVAGIFVISVNTGAYMSEIIRSGIQSIDKGQVEAARSLGFSNMKTMRYVVLPQAIKNSFPAIGNELIVNIKDSSVLMIISITDLMFQSKSIAGTTFRFTETFFLTAMIYLILTSIAALILNTIEKRWMHKNSSIPQSVTMPDQIKMANKEV